MAVEEKTLKAPRDVEDSVSKEAERVKSFLKSRKMRLSDAKAQKIEQDLGKKVEAWKRGTNGMRRRLVRLNDMLEGVVEETNSPFEGASNITVHYSAGIARTFKSTFNKTMYADTNVFSAVVDPESQDPQKQDKYIDPRQIRDLEDGFNHYFSLKYNGLDTLKDGTIPAERDGTLIVTAGWERRVERACDERVYKDASSFQADYPDAESAGSTEDEYNSILDKFLLDPELELHVAFEYDFVSFDGVEFEIAPLARFVTYPVYARSLRRMDLYGRLYRMSLGELRVKAKRGEVYDRAVEKVEAVSRGANPDAWDRSKDYVDGLNLNTEDREDMPLEVADLVYRSDLDGDGIPEKYLVSFAVEAKTVLAVEYYPLRRNVDICVDFRLLSREDRFYGSSLVGDCEDLFNLIDGIHRHRNNIRLLVASPVILAQTKMKDQVDLGRADSVIRPGVTFWVEDIDKGMKQMPLQNFDQPGNSADEESLATRYIEMVFGPTQGMSGKQTPEDRNAPARKTAMLLNQANQRIDDYMDEFRKSFSALGDLFAALLYQYSPDDDIKFSQQREGEDKPRTFSFPKKLLADPRIKWVAKRRSVTLTPEFAMQRIQTLMQTYTSLAQAIAAGDARAVEMWNMQVRNSGEPEYKKLLIDPAKNQQDAAQRAQQAMQQQAAALAMRGSKTNGAAQPQPIGAR